MCEARVPVLGILALRICGFRILPSESLALKSVCGEFECRVLPVFEIPALTIYNRRGRYSHCFHALEPPNLGNLQYQATKSWNLQHFQCSETPQILEFAAFSVQGVPQILELAALSVQGSAQILEFAAFSVQGVPQILEFAAFVEFPVFGSKKLNRWSAPKTRSERDQNEMQICTFWPQLRGRQGIALKVLPKQAFKFKDLRN